MKEKAIAARKEFLSDKTEKQQVSEFADC